MFHILEREMLWRQENGREEGFGALRASRPVVAVGAEDPLEDQKMLADYFRMSTIHPAYTIMLTIQTAAMAWEESTPVYEVHHVAKVDLVDISSTPI